VGRGSRPTGGLAVGWLGLLAGLVQGVCPLKKIVLLLFLILFLFLNKTLQNIILNIFPLKRDI
jgi:hypothetical protein